METNKKFVFDTKEWIKLDGVNDFWKEFPVKSDKPEEQIEGTVKLLSISVICSFICFISIKLYLFFDD